MNRAWLARTGQGIPLQVIVTAELELLGAYAGPSVSWDLRRTNPETGLPDIHEGWMAPENLE